MSLTTAGDLDFHSLEVLQKCEVNTANDEEIREKQLVNPSVLQCSVSKDMFNSTSAFGNISIKESNNVHFGNNTYFNGSVIIKQIPHNGNGIINPSFTSTENEGQRNYESHISATKGGCRNDPVQNWHKFTFSVLCVGILVLGGICTVVAIYVSGNSNQGRNLNDHNDDAPMESEPPPNVPLIIAPGHLRIVSRSDWLAQFVDNKYLGKLKHPVPWVIISHTATESCSYQSQCVLRVRLIQTFHIESRNWSDIGYNFLVGGDGSAYYGRGWDNVGAHTLGYNNISIGISFIGTFNDVYPPKYQLKACQKLIEQGVELGKVAKDYKLFGHRQLSSTLSPGDKLFEVISKWPHFVANFTNVL